MRNTLAKIVCFLSLAACSPYVEGLGPEIQVPVMTERSYETTDGTKLRLRTWPAEGNPTAILIGVHGFNDYGNFLNPDFPTYLQARGISLLTYDQRGFGDNENRGLWAGAEALSHDLADFITLVHKRENETPLFILGESMGGAVVINTMARYPDLPVEGVVLSAPALWGPSTWPWYQRMALNVFAHSVPWLKLSGGGIVQPTDHIENWKNWSLDPLIIRGTRVDALWGVSQLMGEALEHAPKLKQPTLLLYGKNDEVIPKDPIRQFLENAPNTMTFSYYDDGWHWLPRDKNAQAVWEDIVSWMTALTRPLPSGSDYNAKARLAQ